MPALGCEAPKNLQNITMFVKKKIKKRLTSFNFLCNMPQRIVWGGLGEFFDRERTRGQCKFSDFFEFRIFLGATNY